MRSGSTWWLSWMLVLVCSGCAEMRNEVVPPQESQARQSQQSPQEQQQGPQEQQSQVVQAKAAVPLPKCPERIAQEEPLEAEFVSELGPRSFVPGLELSQLGLLRSPGPEVKSSFQSQLTLAEGPLELVGVTIDKGAGLLLLRPEADGYCVVNTWSTWQAAEVQYALDASWTSPDGRMAILVLKMVVGPGTSTEERRWVVLGTDGWRAWIALGTPPQHQLLVPAVGLLPKGKQLYLDVKRGRTSRFALGKDGRFITGR